MVYVVRWILSLQRVGFMMRHVLLICLLPLSLSACTNGNRCDANHPCYAGDICDEGFCSRTFDNDDDDDERDTSRCGENAVLDPEVGGCVCRNGFVQRNETDCTEDHVAFCREIGIANAEYCNRNVEACACTEGFELSSAGQLTNEICCCLPGFEAVDGGFCV